MEKSKIKNIIIIILALANAFLLMLLISDSLESARVTRLRDEAIAQLLSGRSITLSEEARLLDTAPSEISLERDLDEERKSVSALIGDSRVSDMGGDIYIYSGEHGEARFHSDGSFELFVTENAFSQRGAPVKTAQAALARMGIDATTQDAQVDEQGETVNVTLFCVYEGSTVYSSTATCTFINDNLTFISGRKLPSGVRSEYAPQDYPDVATIIMSLLRHIESTGEVCTQINTIESGYFAESPQIGVFKLRPVWRISINGGKTFYFDAFSGKVTLPDNVYYQPGDLSA